MTKDEFVEFLRVMLQVNPKVAYCTLKEGEDGTFSHVAKNCPRCVAMKIVESYPQK